jgi:uncharacterized membrane protein YGL010W
VQLICVRDLAFIVAMKTIHGWFSEYEVSHQNSVNKALHWLGIPLIVMAILGLSSLLGSPFAESSWGGVWLNVAGLLVALAVIGYARLSISLAVGLGLVFTSMLLFVRALAWLPIPLSVILVGLFVIGWVAQLVGHRIEGKKPSFGKDLVFLFIGPLWLLAFVYRRLGIRY